MYKAVIFDVDGTLVDSSYGIIAAVSKVIVKYNLRCLTEQEMRTFIGVSPIQRAFSSFCHINNELSQVCSDEYRKNYLEGDLYKARLYKDIVKLLTILRTNHISLGVASFKRQDTLEKILKHFELNIFFDSICGASIADNMTKSNILENCINRLRVASQETLFIGDTLTDCMAAQHAGCKFLAVAYGFGFKDCDDINKGHSHSVLMAKDVKDIINYFNENYFCKN